MAESKPTDRISSSVRLGDTSTKQDKATGGDRGTLLVSLEDEDVEASEDGPAWKRTKSTIQICIIYIHNAMLQGGAKIFHHLRNITAIGN